MKKILTAESFPFILTILIGLVGYQFNQLSERVIASPTIEYQFKVVNEKDTLNQVKRKIECRITNISSDKSFKDLIINFKFKTATVGLIYNPDIIIEHPSSLHNEIADGQIDSVWTEYKIAHFQPSCTYLLKATTLSAEKSEVFPNLHLTSDETIIAVEASGITWIVKNYFMLNLVCLGIWLAFITIYLINYTKKP